MKAFLWAVLMEIVHDRETGTGLNTSFTTNTSRPQLYATHVGEGGLVVRLNLLSI